MKAPRSGAAGGVLEMELDMTKGSPFKLIVRFIIPIIIGNIFQQLYSLVDTVIVDVYKRQVVGSADFKNVPDEKGQVEIGYGLSLIHI